MFATWAKRLGFWVFGVGFRAEEIGLGVGFRVRGLGMKAGG